jgi:hypothetical protein
MIGFFVTALFTSAMLLFWVQPMVAKLLLPLLGGTPMVWNTCMVFFQATLLAGYGYAHFLTTRFPFRAQTCIHLVLMVTALSAMPIGLSFEAAHSAPWQSDPFVWQVRALFAIVALPFFVVSASGPLLQSWFSHSRHRFSADPYFLYAASNLGSIVGLIGYPVIMEQKFRLDDQAWLWTSIYTLLVILFACCGIAVWLFRDVARAAGSASSDISTPAAGPCHDPVTYNRRLRWILWAFIPSSLLLGVTTYLTTDLASVPLLWVIPLGIYLLTFVLAFSKRQLLQFGWLVRGLPIGAVTLIFMMLADIRNPTWVLIGFHLAVFFLVAMVFHTRLANDRPSSGHLTEFYFCLSVGGVLGGIFNALLAPVIFSTILEYPLIIVLACFAWARIEHGTLPRVRDWRNAVPALGIGLMTAVLAYMIPHWVLEPRLRMLLVFGVPLLLCYFVSPHPLRFAAALGAVLLVSGFYTAVHGHTLHEERSFFGTLRVTKDPEGCFYRLYHGSTVHGIEFIAPERRGEPVGYYYPTGPCGQAMRAFNSRPAATNIAVLGLGIGGLASYAQPGQHWTFYEIDPAVIRIAHNTNFFHYLEGCTNAVVDFKVGDARLRLQEAPAKHFDLIVCDAFGSDAPPLHLLTHEAMDMYLSKLAPHGMILCHISSRYLDFRPVIANLAAASLLTAVAQFDTGVSENELREGKFVTHWVALARRAGDLGPLATDRYWHRVPPAPGMRLWTDDYSDILAICQWR